MHDQKLVTMVNQIAEFYRRQPEAAAETSLHLEHYWEPRMRRAICAHLEAGGEGLSEISRAAVALLAARDGVKKEALLF